MTLLKDCNVHSRFCFHCEDTVFYVVGQCVMYSAKAEHESVYLGILYYNREY